MALYEIDTFYDAIKKYTVTFGTGIICGYLLHTYVNAKFFPEDDDTVIKPSVIERIIADEDPNTR